MPSKKLFKCSTCGAEFLDWESQRQKKSYCSKECYAKSLRGKTPHNKGKLNHISKPCTVCGKLITGMPSSVNRRKFCSQVCAGFDNRRTKDMKQFLLSSITKIEGKDCWFWNKRINGGYGRHSIMGKQYYAHRLSYEEFVGPIPEGMFLDHLCRNRSCINPEHLEVVTLAENVRRGEAGKGPRSESHKRAVSAANKKRYADPSARMKQKEILDAARNSQNRLESLRRALSDPDYRKARSEQMKKIWAQRRGDTNVGD